MKFSKALLAFVPFVAVAPIMADNNDLVVFVHGYGGSKEHYQYQAELEAAGLKSISVDVDPYASNFDRAAEFYAQMKGTITDYGACHSLETFHVRYGKDHTGKGLYPEWDENHKIHIIGHSQGGLTVRLVERLLMLGSGCDRDDHEFYQGGKNWITSVTTMATPNNGATLFDPDFGNIVEQMMILQSAESGRELSFPQWGLERAAHETFDDFFQRVKKTGLFQKENFGIFDMSTKGAEKFNNDKPNVFAGTYYFAIATERTNPEDRCTLLGCDIIEVPDDKMNDYYKLQSAIIGSSALPEDRENDGIVSNRQARCPMVEEICIKVEDGDTNTWEHSKWHWMDVYFLDHMQLVLRDTNNDNSNFMESAKRIWTELGLRLKKLPSTSAQVLSSDALFESSEETARVERYLKTMWFMSDASSVETEGNSKAPVGVWMMIVVAFAGLVASAFLVSKQIRKSPAVENSPERKVSV